MLDGLAEQILNMRTPTFSQFMGAGGLGDSNMYYTATKNLGEEEMANYIRRLRKEE